MSSTAEEPALAIRRRFMERLHASWPVFLARRKKRLEQFSRNGTAAEKVAENILEDLFTVALDWSLADINYQLGRADLVLTKVSLKRLIIEAKRPESLKANRRLFEQALAQVQRYAAEQRVKSIAISDGTLLYAADLVNGGLRPRALLRLDDPAVPQDAWWLSVDGIYRPAQLTSGAFREDIQGTTSEDRLPDENVSAPRLLHRRHKVPAECFAYVGDASDPDTWKLLYRLPGGAVDEAHLPGAIRAVTSVYRSNRVKIPEEAVPDVLVRLGKAAKEIRMLPGQTSKALVSYRQLYEALLQCARADEIQPL